MKKNKIDKKVVGFWLAIIFISGMFFGFLMGSVTERVYCNEGLEYISDTYLDITWKIMEEANITEITMECNQKIEELEKQIMGGQENERRI